MMQYSFKNNFNKAFIAKSDTIKDAVKSLNQSSLRICLVVNDSNQLIGTVSDGDLRRGILKGLTLDDKVESVVKFDPLVVPQNVDKHVVKQIMLTNKIGQVPELNQNREVINLHCLENLYEISKLPNRFVIMAGGKGVRLNPLTDHCPKPMLEINGKPIILKIIEKAKSEGFCDFVISINYLGHMIEDYFKDGSEFGIKIEYLREDTPLGTAGALSLLSTLPNKPLVVTNGDVISDIQYSDLLDFHERYNSDATMAVRLQERQNPYGVVKMDGVKVIGIDEKPKEQFHVNAGIYVLAPSSIKILLKNKFCDMPEFFERLNNQSLGIYAYPMHEPWLDVGSHQDFQKANS